MLQAVPRQVHQVADYVGQVVLLAKHHAGSSWTSPSVPRGQSAAFNRQPTKDL